MRALWYFGVIAVAASGLGGCVSNDYVALFEPSAPPAVDPNDVNAPAPVPSKMPWQLTPASTASIAQGEKTIIVANGRFGKVKGTPLAVANLDKPLIAFARRGPIVAACRSTIEPQAKSIGAYSVQAAAAGPERRNPDGDRMQQVFFRIIYDRAAYLEVRQSALLCTIDGKGQVVDAHPV